jgi:hypothetical protein
MMVAVHAGVGAVLQEVGGLGAGTHLGTVGPRPKVGLRRTGFDLSELSDANRLINLHSTEWAVVHRVEE